MTGYISVAMSQATPVRLRCVEVCIPEEPEGVQRLDWVLRWEEVYDWVEEMGVGIELSLSY